MKDQQIAEISKLLKSLSHPLRLKILCILQDGELSVGEMQERLQASQANISQHLGILRNQQVIDFRKEGNFIFNRISDQRVTELLHTLQQLFCVQTNNE